MKIKQYSYIITLVYFDILLTEKHTFKHDATFCNLFQQHHDALTCTVLNLKGFFFKVTKKYTIIIIIR